MELAPGQKRKHLYLGPNTSADQILEVPLISKYTDFFHII